MAWTSVDHEVCATNKLIQDEIQIKLVYMYGFICNAYYDKNESPKEMVNATCL